MADVSKIVLSSIRFLIGTGAVFFPISTAKLFLLEATISSAPYIRLVGSRDFVLGGLLWTSDDPKTTRRALIAGALCDAIDLLGLGLCLYEGSVGTPQAAVFLGVAVPVISLALWALPPAAGAKRVS